MARKATALDVARLARASRSAVSMVFNGRADGKSLQSSLTMAHRCLRGELVLRWSDFNNETVRRFIPHRHQISLVQAQGLQQSSRNLFGDGH